MDFDLIRFDPAVVNAEVSRLSASLKSNKGLSDLAGHGVGVVARRLQRDRLRYRDYGPLWWALKDVLRAAGQHVGDNTEPAMAARFKGATPAHTLVMADTFRSILLASHPVGTSRFTVSSEGDSYDLFDPDMESPARA